MPSSIASGNRELVVQWTSPTVAYASDVPIFTAPFECVVMGVAMTHSQAGNDAGTVTLQLHNDDATDAPGAGDALLSNNSNAGFNLKATANTVQNGAFKAGVSRKVAKGNRLSLNLTGTPTNVGFVNVTVWLNRRT